MDSKSQFSRGEIAHGREAPPQLYCCSSKAPSSFLDEGRLSGSNSGIESDDPLSCSTILVVMLAIQAAPDELVADVTVLEPWRAAIRILIFAAVPCISLRILLRILYERL